MAEAKQILVVDDHFEVLEFLRSMLELADQNYKVLGVPSAEEGFLELRRTPFDLLITDVRLPGISGFELVRRVQKVQPDIPIIMITAYSSAQGKEEAEQLGVFRYFQKPLDTEALLAAVHHALYDAVDTRVPEVKEEGGKAPLKPGPAVEKRLRTLRTDTGAAQVTLATAAGEVVLTVGEHRGVNVSRLAQIIADNLQNGFLLAEELGSVRPLMIHYQAGERVDLYSANISHTYFVILLFDVQARRGRIGTVWIFTQRAIKALAEMLPAAGSNPLPKTVKESRASVKATIAPSRRSTRTKRRRNSPAPKAKNVTKASDEQAAPAGAEAVETDGIAESDPELAALLEGEAADVDLDAFWTEAASEDAEIATSGLSFEEALQKGLLPPEFEYSDD